MVWTRVRKRVWQWTIRTSIWQSLRSMYLCALACSHAPEQCHQSLGPFCYHRGLLVTAVDRNKDGTRHD